jgi:hypothetical protein
MMADDPPGSMRVCLERLRDVLARAPRHGGVAADRLALLQRLLAKTAEAAAAAPELQAVLLEVCAYLVAPGEEKAAEEVVNLLREALRHDHAAVRRAAVLGYGRFPSIEGTRQLVRAAVRARKAGEQAVLAAALTALAAPGHLAPDSDAETFPAWLELVDTVLRDHALPEAVREAALAVLDRKGAQGKLLGQVFAILTQVTLDPAQAPVVRERAAVMLLPHAADDASAASTYVDALTKLLTDPEKRMRLKGAQLLQNLPRHRDQPDAFRGQIIRAVGEVLAKETDETVLRALVTCLERQVDPEKPDLEPVISRLCLALKEMGRAGVVGARRQLLVSALAGQAATQGLATMQWVTAADALLQLGERREARNVIERQKPLRLADRTGNDKTSAEVQRLALECVVKTALLKPRDEPWTAREAEDVLGALQQLENQNGGAHPISWASLRIEVLGAAARWDEVLQRGEQELAAGKLEPADRERVRVAMLRAFLAKNLVDDAKRLLEAGVAAGEPARLAQLREEVGMALLRLDRPKEALVALVEAQQATAESDPAFPRRLLRRLDVEAKAEPDSRASVLQRLLEREPLFTAADVPAEVRAEFEQVKAALSGKQ